MEKDENSVEDIVRLARKFSFEKMSQKRLNEIANAKIFKYSKETTKYIMLRGTLLRMARTGKNSLSEREVTDAFNEFAVECNLEYLRRRGELKRTRTGPFTYKYSHK